MRYMQEKAGDTDVAVTISGWCGCQSKCNTTFLEHWPNTETSCFAIMKAHSQEISYSLWSFGCKTTETEGIYFV